MRGPTMLPSLAELTTGVSPYNSGPAYSMASGPPGLPALAGPASMTSPRHLAGLGSPGMGYSMGGYSSSSRAAAMGGSYEPMGLKRRAENDIGLGVREARRRHLEPRPDSGEEYEARYEER